MIGCLLTRVRKQPIIALYFESENELKLYNLRPDCIPEIVFLHSFLNFFKHFIVCALLNSHMCKVNGQCMHKSPDLSVGL